ncbi:MAG: hypothetical protein GW748_06570 [Alphaproteobacteria bacterium]|nr:hypothetical protein [Alphaproteobacteria bacterium]NCQ67390.1 hypothetical protein [Alphaproteobacteria bacterium]NCT06644.1 hypothetical protein [Alphaproteobacteria bacterium]
MSYLSLFVFVLSCGSLVQASSFDPREFGYNEKALLNVMMERGATSYGQAAEMLDHDAAEMYRTFGFEAYARPTLEEKSSFDVNEEASLALIRRLQEEDNRSSVPKIDVNEELSLALIRQLQEEEQSSVYSTTVPTVSYVDPETVLSTTHKETLKALFLSAQSYDNGDVHAFNKGWSKTNIGAVQDIFQEAFGAIPSLSFSALKAEILSYQDSTAIRNALAQLEAYGLSGFADAESGVGNTLAVLSQNWHIASTDTGLNRRFVFDESGVAKNSKDFVIHSLLENAATGGGCSPGFAGRFVRDQLILLCVQGGVDGS